MCVLSRLKTTTSRGWRNIFSAGGDHRSHIPPMSCERGCLCIKAGLAYNISPSINTPNHELSVSLGKGVMVVGPLYAALFCYGAAATQVASDEKRFSSKMMCFQLNSNLPLVLSNPKGENQAPSTRIRCRRNFNIFSTSNEKRFSFKIMCFQLN